MKECTYCGCQCFFKLNVFRKKILVCLNYFYKYNNKKNIKNKLNNKLIKQNIDLEDRLAKYKY